MLTSVSGTDAFIATTEMYVVPGGDSWDVGRGPRISVTVAVKTGSTYEVRMYSARIPSEELKLRTSLREPATPIAREVRDPGGER